MGAGSGNNSVHLDFHDGMELYMPALLPCDSEVGSSLPHPFSPRCPLWSDCAMFKNNECLADFAIVFPSQGILIQAKVAAGTLGTKPSQVHSSSSSWSLRHHCVSHGDILAASLSFVLLVIATKLDSPWL